MAASHTAQAPRDALVHVSMIVNGTVRTLIVEPRMTLLDALRDELTLTGSKKSYDRGECGARTVQIESRRVLSYMTLAQSAYFTAYRSLKLSRDSWRKVSK